MLNLLIGPKQRVLVPISLQLLSMVFCLTGARVRIEEFLLPQFPRRSYRKLRYNAYVTRLESPCCYPFTAVLVPETGLEPARIFLMVDYAARADERQKKCSASG